MSEAASKLQTVVKDRLQLRCVLIGEIKDKRTDQIISLNRFLYPINYMDLGNLLFTFSFSTSSFKIHATLSVLY